MRCFKLGGLVRIILIRIVINQKSIKLTFGVLYHELLSLTWLGRIVRQWRRLVKVISISREICEFAFLCGSAIEESAFSTPSTGNTVFCFLWGWNSARCSGSVDVSHVPFLTLLLSRCFFLNTPFSATFVSLSCTFDLCGRSASFVVGSIHSFLGPSRPQSEVNSEIMRL